MFLLAVRAAALTPGAFKYLAGERLKGEMCNSETAETARTCAYVRVWHRVMTELSAVIEKLYFPAFISPRSAMKSFVNWPKT